MGLGTTLHPLCSVWVVSHDSSVIAAADADKTTTTVNRTAAEIGVRPSILSLCGEHTTITPQGRAKLVMQFRSSVQLGSFHARETETEMAQKNRYRVPYL